MYVWAASAVAAVLVSWFMARWAGRKRTLTVSVGVTDTKKRTSGAREFAPQWAEPVAKPKALSLAPKKQPRATGPRKVDAAVMARTAVYTVQGPRATMADTHVIASLGSSGAAACCVFDGCGGSRASTHAAKAVRELLTKNPTMALDELLLSAEASTLESAMASNPSWLDATTAVVARVDWEDRTLEVAWIGDSPCVLARRVGSKLIAEKMTRDHNAANKAEEKRVREAGGRVGRNEHEANAGSSRKLLGKLMGPEHAFNSHRKNPKRVYPGSITLTRAIGGLPLKRAVPKIVIADPECLPKRTLDDDDIFAILASDGLFEGSLEPQQAVDIVAEVLAEAKDHGFAKENQPPKTLLERAAEALVWTAQARGSTDNTTCLIVDLKALRKTNVH